MQIQRRKASRRKAKIRMSLASPTGFGKTYSALLLAYGITGDWSKITVIDTENESADLYEDLGDYNVVPLAPPYTPERYIEAIRQCEDAGDEVIIIDSVTHVWHGKGGLLEYKDSLGGKFQDWAKVTPMYQEWLNAILHSKAHVICCVRKKQAYNMTLVNGMTKVEKAGLDDQIRDGFDYEMTIAFEIINDNHMVNTSKDRTRLFMNKPEFVITPETGRMIAEWCESGVDITAQVKEGIQGIETCTTADELELLTTTVPVLVAQNAEFMAAVNARMNEFRNADAKSAASEIAGHIDRADTPEALTLLVPKANSLPQPHKNNMRVAIGKRATENHWKWNAENNRFEAEPASQPQAGNESAPATELPADTSGAANPTEKPADDIIEEYKPKIQAIETPEALTKMLEEVNGLPAEAAKSLRRTVAAKARNSGWVLNPESKAFEYAPAGNAGGSTVQPKAPESRSEQSPMAPAAAPAAQPVAQSQKKDWFVERIGKRIWMQARPGSEESQYTGPYPTDSVLDDAFPDYLLGLQQTEGYTFRDLTPEEAAA